MEDEYGKSRESGAGSMIIFGTGEVGKKVIPLLEKECGILFCTDNDQSKWGKPFGGYIINSPEKIRDYDCGVVVAVSGKYENEVIGQLIHMGISEERIYFFRQDEIYPLDAEKMRGTGIPLIQYDLLHAREEETGNRKVMVLCSAFSLYTKQLIENISARYADIEFSLLTCAEESRDKIIAKALKHIYCYRTLRDLKTILEQLPVYDAMQMLWIEPQWVYCCRLARTKTKRLNLNVGGSDFYRASAAQRDYKRKLLEKADRITAETKQTILDFKGYYGEAAQKTGLLPFGIEVLDFIKKNVQVSRDSIKEKFGFPTDKIIVTCGHNANRAHQHMKIIEAIESLSENMKKQIMLVFPMTYNQIDEEYIREVSNAVDGTGTAYTILTKFMDFQEMAQYALISDIMIHVQTSDQLSSTMLEEMYAGSVVIAGSWLPYQSLHEMGIYFLDVDTIPDVTGLLQDIVLNMDFYKEKCAGNREIIWKHSSWDEQAPKWHGLWE